MLTQYARVLQSYALRFLALFGLKTWGDCRALIHGSTPGVLAILVGLHLLTGSGAALLGALLVAVTSPLLARVNTLSGFRKWFYSLLVPLQLCLVGWGILTTDHAGPIFAILAAIVGSGVAVVNTTTSP